MKTYYTDYVNHMLRHFIRAKKPCANQNYMAVNRVFRKLEIEDKEIIRAVYSRNDTFGDNVYEVAKARGVNQEEVYRMIATVSKRIAKERGLL